MLRLEKKFFYLRNFDYNLIFLLSLPLLLLLSNTEWMFPYGNPTDNWLNYVYYFDYGNPAMVDGLFSYKSTRLSWLLKGMLFFRLLPPLVAYYSLHLLMLYGCILSFYFIGKCLFNKHVALLGAIAFGTYSQFHSIISFEWDYHTHDSILNFLLTLLCLTLAAQGKRWKLCLFLAGIFCACALQSPYFVGYMPIIAFWYLFINYYHARNPILKSILWFSIGGVVITLLFCIVSYFAGGPFFYYLPQIKFALEWGNQGRFQSGGYWVSLWTALQVVRGIVFPFYATLSSFILLSWILSTKAPYKKSTILCITIFLYSFTLHVLLHVFAGHPFLNDNHLIIPLSPMVFLVIVALYAFFTSKVRITIGLKVAVFFILSGVLIFGLDSPKLVDSPFYFPIFNSLRSEMLFRIFPIFAIAGVLIIFIFSFLKRREYIPVLLITIFVALLNIDTTSIPPALYAWNFKCGHLRDQYVAILEGSHAIRKFDPNNAGLLWFSSYEVMSHPNKTCAAMNLASIYGHPVVPTGALYGAMWGMRYAENYDITRRGNASVKLNADIVQKALSENYKDRLTPEVLVQLKADDLKGALQYGETKRLWLLWLSNLVNGILGGYMYTKSFANLPDAAFWKLVLPDQIKLIILAATESDHILAIQTLKKLGFSLKGVDRKQIKAGSVSYYITFGEMVRDGTYIKK